MTLNDLERLERPFTLNFHYYELPLTFFHLFTVEESIYILHTHVTDKDVRKQSKRTVIRRIFGIGKTSIFRRRYILGTLINKANISSLSPFNDPKTRDLE